MMEWLTGWLMEWLTGSLTGWKIPVGEWAKLVFDGLKLNFRPQFKALGDAAEGLITGLSALLQDPPPWLLAFLAGLLAAWIAAGLIL